MKILFNSFIINSYFQNEVLWSRKKSILVLFHKLKISKYFFV